jgi:hypothetical protein
MQRAARCDGGRWRQGCWVAVSFGILATRQCRGESRFDRCDLVQGVQRLAKPQAMIQRRVEQGSCQLIITGPHLFPRQRPAAEGLQRMPRTLNRPDDAHCLVQNGRLARLVLPELMDQFELRLQQRQQQRALRSDVLGSATAAADACSFERAAGKLPA